MAAKKKPRLQEKQRPGRSLWTGSISFGLVNIPVSLQSAVREKGVRFHLFREKGHCKVRQKLICESDQKEVSRDEIVKGFELEKGRYVMLHEEDIAKLSPKATREIALQQFIDLHEIDPVFFSQSYYLVPQKNGKKAYFLLKEALKQSGKVGIAKLVMRNRQYLAALRVFHDALCLVTLHYFDEIITPQAVEEADFDLSRREVEAAEKLIASLTEKFKPEQYHDNYRELLLKLIHEQKTVKTALPEKPAEASQVVDLIAALEKSLPKTRKRSAA